MVPIWFIFAFAGAILLCVIIAMLNAKKHNTRPENDFVAKPDRKEADLIKKAEAGDAEAQYKLAQTYEFKESGKYIYWLEKAAEQGYEKAIQELAEAYDHGNDVAVPPIKANRKKAVEYFTRLADKGDAEAMKRISLIYYVSLNNEVKGREWTEKAAAAGDIECMVELGNDYRLISDIHDFDKSEYWYKKAADLGSGEAMKGIGDLYCYDKKQSDYFKAESWYKKAVAAGYYFAYVRLGDMCREGKGCSKDARAAFGYYKKAADKGEVSGRVKMAEAYLSGDGCERDKVKAIEILQAACKDSIQAQYRLGLCYFEGDGVEKDYKRAVQLFNDCYKFERNASYKLGECYYNGYGVNADKEKARELWLKSANSGNTDAKDSLKIYFHETVD